VGLASSGRPALRQGPLSPVKRVLRLVYVPQEDAIDRNLRVNDQIRISPVRVINAEGAMLGVMPTGKALETAREAGLDLVEVAANERPPVCKIMDFGKYKYEQDQRRKESRKRASNVVIKEMKFRPKIDSHDYDTKMKHVERFLEEGSKVKLTIMFRGREMAHPELGRRILEKVAERVAEIAVVESAPKQDGRNMVMVLNPIRKPKTKPAAQAANV
jgi:translation initiation factor IF-3